MIILKRINNIKKLYFLRPKKFKNILSKKKKYFKYFYLFNNIFIILLLIFQKEDFPIPNKEIVLKEYCPQETEICRLKKLPRKKNHQFILKENHYLLKYISKCTKNKITQIRSIFLNCYNNFGNQLILLNKVIFYCEILRCERIILNKNFYWFIKNKILDKEYNITIEIGEEKNYRNKSVLIDYTYSFFFYFNVFEPRYRPEVLKNELLNNLPKIKVSPNDLYIYVRSGDIFINFDKGYIQPPLCFYQELINIFKFNQLLSQFPNIKYKKNPMKLDISYLIYAYNVVGAFSTFINSIVRYNDNLQNFYYFNFIINYHFYNFFYFVFYHHVNKYIMNESDYYKKIDKCLIIDFKKIIMFNYKCPNKILKIK
jgi:hypothetical protein